MDYKLTLLNDKFNIYNDAAKKAHAEGNYIEAKRNYMLAAETMLQLAKLSTPELKKARVERAKNLIVTAENIEKIPVKQPVKKSNNTSVTQDEQSEDKKWSCASIPNIKFADVAGLADVKKAVTIKMINPIKYPEQYKIYGKKTGGGVLLYGPPGTGKTMIAKAIACEVGATFFAIKGSDIVSKWVGESEKNINSLFEAARKEKLSIIFLDEMDSLIGKRGEDANNDKRVNEFLQQIDGFVGKNPNLLLLGATNRPWDIDGAAVRSGRFSQKIYVSLPDEEAREFLFNKAINDVPIDNDVDVIKLVELTNGYSGADIDEVCDRAKDTPLLEAINNGTIVNVTMQDFLDAINKVKPTVTKAEIKKFEEYSQNN